MNPKQIKFRVWDNLAKEFNKEKEVLLSGDNKIYRIHTITGELQQLYPEHLEVEFFLGLDKNGKELYENDIIKWCNIEYNFWVAKLKTKGHLESIIEPLNPDNNKNILLPEYCEVIGNIHENPELLESLENKQ